MAKHELPLAPEEGDIGLWPDLISKAEQGNVTVLGQHDLPIQLVAIGSGLLGGSPTVAMRLDLPNGHTIVGITRMSALLPIVSSLRTSYGNAM